MEHIIKDIVNSVNYNKELYKLKGVIITSVFEDEVSRSDEDEREGNGSISHYTTKVFNKIVEVGKSTVDIDCSSNFFENTVMKESRVNKEYIEYIKHHIRCRGIYETLSQKRDIENEEDEYQVYYCCSTKYIITTIDKLNCNIALAK